MMLSIQNYLRSSPCARAVLYSAIAMEVVYFKAHKTLSDHVSVLCGLYPFTTSVMNKKNPASPHAIACLSQDGKLLSNL